MRLTAEGISFAHRGQPTLFTQLSFTFSAPSLVALTGPSGTGKSTLLGLLAGLIPPTTGIIGRDGISRVQWVFQNPYGSPGRTALDHVALPVLAHGLSRPKAEEVAGEILLKFGLHPLRGRAFKHLSGGEAQRLMLARAVACDPHLLLVDEPTAQLDRKNASQLVRTLEALTQERRIVIVATHDAAVIEACPSVLDLGSHDVGFRELMS